MKAIRKMFCYLLTTVLLLSLAGCAANTQEINWDLYGTWIDVSGQTNGEANFSVSGNLPREYEMHTPVDLELDFCWPDTFRFMNDGLQTYTSYADTTGNDDFPLVFWGSGFAYNSAKNQSVPMTFYLCPDEEFVLINWKDNAALYLVASTDPDADPQEILSFFDYFSVTKRSS